MQPVVTAEEMRALDRATIDVIGLPAMTLMETAGRGVAEAALRMLANGRTHGVRRQRGRDGDHVAVICGPGNNGGDGFVASRVLRDHGVDAVVYLAVSRDKLAGDALTHFDIYERAGGVVLAIDEPAGLAEQRMTIERAAIAIDALFGIGPVRPIEGHLAQVVSAINAARQRLAVDVPSGVDSDTGLSVGACVEATRTVTMGAAKVALVGAPGFARAGVIEVCDIGVPAVVMATANVRAGLIEERDVRGWLPETGLLDHKGTRGHVVVIGGALRGAGRLAANAALRAGAGLVTLAGEGEVVADDSVMTRSLGGSGATQLDVLLVGKQAVVIGPGLGQRDPADALVREVLALGIPAVLDADALNLVSQDPGAIAKAAGPIVITPHPGEAARLLGIPTAAVEANRLSAARTLAKMTGAVVVLKGARTVICDGTIGDDFCAINPTGSPGLATAGSGDVLAGAIAALIAQGTTPADAACCAAFLHGRAGEALFATHGRGAVSSDLPLAFALATKQLADL
ncbi:MAG: NAD(P)H-hydrate dehydratase [Kofleriaceae bacterium]